MILDRRHRSGGFAPGAGSLCLKLHTDTYFGGQIQGASSISSGEEQILSGFVGCMDHLFLNGVRAPINQASTSLSISSAVTLKTVFNVELGNCNLVLTAPFPTDNDQDCSISGCENNGKCEVSGKINVCVCPSGWIGDRCDVDVDECSIEEMSSKKSCHSLAKCVNLPGTYRCLCPANVTGCVGDLASNSTSLSNAFFLTVDEMIALAFALIFLFILACCCSFCWSCRRQYRRKAKRKARRSSTIVSGPQSEFLLKNQEIYDSFNNGNFRQNKTSQFEMTSMNTQNIFSSAATSAIQSPDDFETLPNAVQMIKKNTLPVASVSPQQKLIAEINKSPKASSKNGTKF